MSELIVFPDVEDLLRRHLKADFTGRAGYTTVKAYAATLPATLPDRSVLVRRVGGVSQQLVLDVARVTVECRAKTGTTAERLAALVRALIGLAEREGRLVDVPIYEVREVSGPYLDPDPVHPTQPRYSATYQIAVRGSAA